VPPGVLWQHGWTLIKVLTKEIYHLGIRAKETRAHFWKTFLPLLRKNPAALEAFAFDASVFYHLHRHAGYVHCQLERYLSAPSCDDVLDEIARVGEPPGVARPASGFNVPSLTSDV
jgi:hypothetical protein